MFVRCLDKGELADNSSLNCEKYLRDVASLFNIDILKG